ncbi:DsbA family oxidoreductase [Cypionkella sp.]|uniref:DsbA family oxidoreductase n=1 Tax=Cypionkella sp. TaxID=2811411 RepID=UPI00263594FC|nr:DsbA family oxidoreductase [Cypionkella sp.]MDB5664770.1 DsbA family oxidoreductase [Cypionkella sp.]
MIRLDIFSDPVCPWCLIGKAHLDRALEAHADHPFVIAWHPFQLNPDMPPEGVEKRAYLAKRLGGEAKVDAIHDRLRQIAEEAGVAMDPDKPEMLPNTMNAHRMIHWAGIEGKQAAMVSALFRAYWRDGRDIGDSEELCDIAEEIGMDPVALARLLATDADIDDLRARDVDARKKGVTAVPTFLIAQQYVVSGAQPPEVWAQVIEELVAKSTESSEVESK